MTLDNLEIERDVGKKSLSDQNITELEKTFRFSQEMKTKRRTNFWKM